jgi:predicted acetyltransferase
MRPIELIIIQASEKLRLWTDLQSYLAELSAISGRSVVGEFPYQHFKRYWQEPNRWPFWIRSGDQIAGFALVRKRDEGDFSMAEFYIRPEHRRSSLGTAAARSLFERFPGRWHVSEMIENVAAISFWRRALDGFVEYDETVNSENVEQLFEITAGSPEASQLTLRPLHRHEVERVWNIDRSEVIENVYRAQHGALTLRPQHIEVSGWPPGETEKYMPLLLDCFDRGGWVHGAFDHGRIVGAAVLESKFIGERKDQLQLKFLHVSRSHRGRGLGAKLFELAKKTARERGAKSLYISATPSENTVNFYRRLGCRVAEQPDRDLFELEPEDIHLGCEISPA